MDQDKVREYLDEYFKPGGEYDQQCEREAQQVATVYHESQEYEELLCDLDATACL